jgi:hypothetical protein
MAHGRGVGEAQTYALQHACPSVGMCRNQRRPLARSVPRYVAVQVVLGEFDTQQEALQAVRKLERHNVSIQNVVIADRRHRTWRKLPDPPGPDVPRRFLVVMIGEAEEIDHVRGVFNRINQPEPAKRAA